MSNLTDTLSGQGREFLQACKIMITVDSLDTDTVPTYSVVLDAPSFSETVLTKQTPEEVLAATLDFTIFVTNRW